VAHYFGDAVAEIKKIKGTTDGHLDFSTMPSFAVNEKGRDIGATVTMLIVAIQQLADRIEKLEKKN
jgi:hypothetical protein